MKRITDLLTKQVARIFKSILSGKKFQPMPSYWALVPVKHEDKKMNEIIKKNTKTNNPSNNINF